MFLSEDLYIRGLIDELAAQDDDGYGEELHEQYAELYDAGTDDEIYEFMLRLEHELHIY